MPPANTNAPADRRDPAVAAIIRDWRQLTGGSTVRDDARRTLVACSGGADSSALVLALASATDGLVVGHVVHDMRPAPEAEADQERVGDLAKRLGLPLDARRVSVEREPGNAEGAARRLRYAALVEMASARGCPYVATAHQADDQLETLLLRLARGAGPAGLGGIRSRRRLSPGAVLVRPMLHVRRADAERVCRDAGWSWCEDRTNADRSRRRAAVRHDVLPRLLEIFPDAALRASGTATLMHDAARLVRRSAAELVAEGSNDGKVPSGASESRSLAWARSRLASEPSIVLGELVRLAVSRLGRGRGLDRLPRRTLESISRAIRDRSTEPRRFELHSLVVEVTANRVAIAPRSS